MNEKIIIEMGGQIISIEFHFSFLSIYNNIVCTDGKVPAKIILLYGGIRMFRMFRLDVSISLMRESSRTQDRPPKNKKNTQIAALSLSYNISSIIFVSGGEFDQLPSPAGCRSQG